MFLISNRNHHYSNNLELRSRIWLGDFNRVDDNSVLSLLCINTMANTKLLRYTKAPRSVARGKYWWFFIFCCVITRSWYKITCTLFFLFTDLTTYGLFHYQTTYLIFRFHHYITGVWSHCVEEMACLTGFLPDFYHSEMERTSRLAPFESRMHEEEDGDEVEEPI